MIDLSRIICLDFETQRIQPRPKYPPEPVGFAIMTPRSQPQYFAFGHLSENNTTRERAVNILRAFWEDGHTIFLFHNASFDISVAAERLGFRMLPWQRIHDTQFLLFLYDPHSRKLGLKPASEELLEWESEERDAVHEWIWERRVQLMQDYGEGGKWKITRAKSGNNSPAAWIAYAPGELVGRYACGDVDRTLALFKYLYPRILAAGMGDAYDRERRLLPILMENERRGLRVDVEALRTDVPAYRRAFEQVEAQMRGYLGAPDLNFNEDANVAETFAARGIVKEGCWVRTEPSKAHPEGQLSVSKVNLPPESFADPLFAAAFGYRNRLETCLTMFMEPWIEQAERNRGFIHTQWNQTRGERGGARTGRPSMTKPNLLNVSKPFEGRTDGYVHPEELQLIRLPEVRKYILPDPDELFLHRDFAGQEVRMFAHFESGALAEAYRATPTLDPHTWLSGAIEKATGRVLERTRVKNVTFARLYGGGSGAVYAQARCANLAEAKEIMAFHDQALPGRRILSEEIQRLIRRGEPVRTWGGRLYYVEPPSFNEKLRRRQTYEYKIINYLIQGSAADATKEAICRWHEGGGASHGARFLLTVYDEINISSARGLYPTNMQFLRKCMEGIEIDVPMLSDGKIGERWGDLRKPLMQDGVPVYDAKGWEQWQP